MFHQLNITFNINDSSINVSGIILAVSSFVFFLVGLASTGSSAKSPETIDPSAWIKGSISGAVYYLGLYLVDDKSTSSAVTLERCRNTSTLCQDCDDVADSVVALLVFSLICAFISSGVAIYQYYHSYSPVKLASTFIALMGSLLSLGAIVKYNGCLQSAYRYFDVVNRGPGWICTFCGMLSQMYVCVINLVVYMFFNQYDKVIARTIKPEYPPAVDVAGNVVPGNDPSRRITFAYAREESNYSRVM